MNAVSIQESSMVEPLAVISRFRDHDYSLQEFLAARVERQPDACALEFEGRAWSYAELERTIGLWASWLSARGVVRGDCVAVMAANHPHTIALLFALARLGAILVPVNPEYGVRETAYVLGHAQVKGVVATPDKTATVTAALRESSLDAWAVATGDALEAELAAAPAGNTPRLDGLADTACLIIYTSGTTGFPKGAMHGQRGFALTAEAFVERLWLQPDERVMCVMPMFHINALMYSLGGALACGGTLILVRRFSAGTFWQMAADTRATQVNLVAAAGSILAQRPRSEFVPGHNLGKMFVAPQTQQMVDALRNELGVPVLIECYGMTEIPGVISNPFKGPHKLGTMGILCKHPDDRIERPQARIVDDEGRDVPAGVTGELLIRTPTLMLGYYRDPAQTQAAFLDGWFRTGDLVTQAEDGFFRFVARKKDIIRRRGENIASAEIERIIGEHPQVADVAVVGVPSDLGEEDILAAVVLVPGEQADAGAIAAWTRERLAAVKVPRYIAFVAAIPHTATHKPAKHRLKEDPDLLRNAIDIQAAPAGRSTEPTP
ncbi:MAG: AMP-binding protein [Pseudomonadota bacterium]